MDIKTRLFGKRQERYPVSAAQNAARTARSLEAAAYVGIAALALVTGAHAVMLVLHESAEFTLAGQTGLLLVFFTALRVGFPLLVELAAIVSVVGSIRGKWRGDQKGWAGRIEKIWLVFAAANMITFFAVERSAELQSWQIYWLQYGLPVSGIISGVWLAKLLLADPLHQRAEEEAETEEQREANQAIARAEVENSEAMMMVLKRRAWRDYANDLRAQGYDEEEIRFILSHVPELRQSVPDAPQKALPAPVNGANGHTGQMSFDAPAAPQGQQRSDLPPAGNGRAPGNGRPKAELRQPTPDRPLYLWERQKAEFEAAREQEIEEERRRQEAWRLEDERKERLQKLYDLAHGSAKGALGNDVVQVLINRGLPDEPVRQEVVDDYMNLLTNFDDGVLGCVIMQGDAEQKRAAHDLLKGRDASGTRRPSTPPGERLDLGKW